MNGPKKAYTAPTLVEYGSIGDHTFTTPNGNPKGCQNDCHTDSHLENSANPAS